MEVEQLGGLLILVCEQGKTRYVIRRFVCKSTGRFAHTRYWNSDRQLWAHTKADATEFGSDAAASIGKFEAEKAVLGESNNL